MAIKHIDPMAIGHDEDWEGNNAAFKCPGCEKVFIVSGRIHNGSRACPRCGKSKAYISGGRKSGGTARLEWDDAG